MFTDKVKPQLISEYESWLKGLHRDLINVPGFITVDIIRHQDQAAPEYVILLKFASKEQLETWRNSDMLACWLEELDDLLIKRAPIQEAIGLQLWFTQTGTEPRPLPPYWKRALLTISCVYPMIMFLSWALDPLIGGLPQPFAIFILVIVLASSLTYPILPYANRIMAPWLNRSL